MYSTHFLMFFVGYIVIDDISAGWLTVNIWHNAQYILFVWMFNNNRFKGGIEPQAKFLSYISQTRNYWIYFLVCVGLSTTIYLSLAFSAATLPIHGHQLPDPQLPPLHRRFHHLEGQAQEPAEDARHRLIAP